MRGSCLPKFPKGPYCNSSSTEALAGNEFSFAHLEGRFFQKLPELRRLFTVTGNRLGVYRVATLHVVRNGKDRIFLRIFLLVRRGAQRQQGALYGRKRTPVFFDPSSKNASHRQIHLPRS